VKLLFCKTCPSLTFFNKVDGGGVDASNDCQRVSGDASTKGASDMDHLLLGKFVPGRIFSSQVNKTCGPLMLGVLRKSHPFKVFRSVVQFVSVDVVDRQPVHKTGHKSQGNQPVNKNFWTYVAKFCRDNVVAVAADPRTNLCGLTNAGKRLLFAISSSNRCGNNLWSKDAGILADKPLNTFFGNGYLLHAVNGTAGHG